jgi:hypothetical protein
MPRRLADGEAAAFMRQAGAEPLDAYPGASRPWRCRCLRCLREITPRLDNVRTGCGPCRYCSGQGVDPQEAVAAMRLAGLEPLEPYPGAVKPWRCRCVRCGREVHPRYGSIRKGHGCRWCGTRASSDARRMNRGEGALDHGAAIGMMIDNGLRPLEPFRGAGRPWRWRCTACGGQVVIRLTDVKPEEDTCDRCATIRAGGRRHRGRTAGTAPADLSVEPAAAGNAKVAAAAGAGRARLPAMGRASTARPNRGEASSADATETPGGTAISLHRDDIDTGAPHLPC